MPFGDIRFLKQGDSHAALINLYLGMKSDSGGLCNIMKTVKGQKFYKYW